MRVRIFTLKFQTATEQFDDEELQDFMKDKELLSIREHFFLKHETPYLVVIVTYLLGTPTSARVKKKAGALAGHAFERADAVVRDAQKLAGGTGRIGRCAALCDLQQSDPGPHGRGTSEVFDGSKSAS